MVICISKVFSSTYFSNIFKKISVIVFGSKREVQHALLPRALDLHSNIHKNNMHVL